MSEDTIIPITDKMWGDWQASIIKSTEEVQKFQNSLVLKRCIPGNIMTARMVYNQMTMEEWLQRYVADRRGYRIDWYTTYFSNEQGSWALAIWELIVGVETVWISEELWLDEGQDWYMEEIINRVVKCCDEQDAYSPNASMTFKFLVEDFSG